MEEQAKLLAIIAQKLENKKKRLEILGTQKELLMSDKRMMIDQIKSLSHLITESAIDEEKTIFTTEPKYKLVFSEEEIIKLKKKIWDLLEKF